MITSSGNRMHPTGRLIPEGLDEALVRAVVDDFYGKARTDPVVGPVFNRVIADAEWPAHLDKIASFWSSMLLGTGTYAGRPMPKHLAIPELEDRHFERWLALFKETVDELCPPPVAALFVDRAERIAHSFRLGLAQYRKQDSVHIAVMRAGPDARVLQSAAGPQSEIPGGGDWSPRHRRLYEEAVETFGHLSLWADRPAASLDGLRAIVALLDTVEGFPARRLASKIKDILADRPAGP